jgi:TIGR03009 family protein
MKLQIGLGITLSLLGAVGPLAAQSSQPVTQPVAQQGAAAAQPVVPETPVLQQRTTAPQVPQAPFVLTPDQEARLEHALQDWERASRDVKTFSCHFKRLQYDPIFQGQNNAKTDPNAPDAEDDGELRYGAPDRGMFRVDGRQPEKWICDGRSIFEYDFTKKQVIEHRLPPELQGKAIADGPLPFLFGAPAAKVKQRYFLRVITPAGLESQEIWLQAYPRFQQDAGNFSRTELILNAADKLPKALQIHSPNGKSRTVYVFNKLVINNLFDFLQGDPFKPSMSWGWQKIVEESPAPASAPSQANRQQVPAGRR